MFTVYYSNLLSAQKTLLLQLLRVAPNSNPFESETILVQSQGMAQWLQLQIASGMGIAANVNFTFPNSFFWQQYRLLFPNLPKENIFSQHLITWRLMRLIPMCLEKPQFLTLKHYLGNHQDQIKLFQLADKIAQLFDQYLVYRPNWLMAWENQKLSTVFQEIKNAQLNNDPKLNDIFIDVKWQAELWNLLIEDLKKDTSEEVFITSHRAYIQQKYFEKLDELTETEKSKLPKRIFVFGISALPMAQLEILTKLSEHCDVHLFFISPSQYYWGNILEQKTLNKMALKNGIAENSEQANPLLAVWGKQGKDFYTTLIENEYHSIDPVYLDYTTPTLLSKIKQSILDLDNTFEIDHIDRSIQLHCCHSPLREVEVLHNQLLHLFEQDSTLSPKDIIVMSPDIDQYAPYIHAVFSRYGKEDERYIPFSLSDQKETETNPIIASFLQLLTFKEFNFNSEQILELLDVMAIRNKLDFSLNDIQLLRHYIQQSGIRSGIVRDEAHWQNYTSWQNGLERLLLGNALKAENGIWQESIAFDESYGLTSEMIGRLNLFIELLAQWKVFLSQSHSFNEWKMVLNELVSSLYLEDEISIDSLLQINQCIEELEQQIIQSQFNDVIDIDVLQTRFHQYFSQQYSGLHFLSGKVNFCTLLPMRAIPFKVVCLLGMNETDFPRQQTLNSFDLMQYASKRGDRARRDDDRYLFLEALLSAQDIFYISYVGRSLTNNRELLPSILVSQLMDYLSQNQIDWKESVLIEHPMTAYNAENFKGEFSSYAQEWLTIFNQNNDVQPFLTVLPNSATREKIELDELIDYIQNPINYFFKYHLGVNLSQKEEQIENSEIFELSRLESYQFFEKLLFLDEKKTAQFFKEENLKGNLPANHFSDITQQQLENEMCTMRVAMKEYQDKSFTHFEVNQPFNINNQQVNLVGNIPHQFERDFIFWRVGKLRDKDMIKMWIYHLVLSFYELEHRVVLFYKSGDNVEKLTFNPIEKTLALEKLSLYVQHYLQSFTQLSTALYQGLDDYFKNAQKGNDDLPNFIEKQFYTMKEDWGGEYLARIFSQQAQLDWHEIQQNTESWFKEMNEYKLTSGLEN